MGPSIRPQNIRSSKMPDEIISSSVVICDDIRQETNGKQILIGVYGNAVIVPSMPFSIPLCAWIEYQTREIGVDTVHVRLSYTTGFSVSVRIDIQIHEAGTLGLAIPPVLVSGAADGELVIELSRNGATWREIKRKPIRRGQIPMITLIPGGPSPTA